MYELPKPLSLVSITQRTNPLEWEIKVKKCLPEQVNQFTHPLVITHGPSIEDCLKEAEALFESNPEGTELRLGLSDAVKANILARKTHLSEDWLYALFED